MEILFYRDYIVSSAWELRKKRYYDRYAKACKICGDTESVQLNHIKYGNYGRELDKDLVPLCGIHHKKLHERIGVRGDMHYQTRYFLEEEVAKHDVENEQEVETKPAKEEEASKIVSMVDALLDTASRPIWRIFHGMIGW